MTMEIPEISTNRLRLRPLRIADARDIFIYTRNPNVLRYTNAETPRNLHDAQALTRRLVNKPEGAFTLAIYLKDDPQVIGVIEFGTRDEKGGVDYSMGEEYWNKGIMTEAVGAVIDWGFTTCPELQIISSSAIPENRGSTRVMEKCGMVFERRTQDNFEKLVVPVTLDEYIIRRSDWLRRKNGMT
jgi:[ribosomal protein S5]-alanine N-acetyltransferase